MASRYLDSVPLPTELPIVLDKLIKAILRDQPKDIVEYCAVYFENMEVEQMRKSRKVVADAKIKAEVEEGARKYFGKEMRIVPKEEFIKFIRFFAAEKTEREPFPNSIEQIMHKLSALNTHALTFPVFVETVTEIFSS